MKPIKDYFSDIRKNGIMQDIFCYPLQIFFIGFSPAVF